MGYGGMGYGGMGYGGMGYGGMGGRGRESWGGFIILPYCSFFKYCKFILSFK